VNLAVTTGLLMWRIMINLTKETFSKSLDENDIMIVDFWADWCGPCLKVAPILEAIESWYDLPIYKVNVDEQTELAQKYEITSIPTLLVFEKGIPVKKLVGAYPKHKLVKELEGWI